MADLALRVDQPSVGRAVQRAGAGLLLGDPAFRTAADAVGLRMRAADAVRTAADRLETIVAR